MDTIFSRTKPIGLRGRLLLSFLGICILVALSTGVALFSFDVLRKALVRVTEQRAPQAMDALELSRYAEKIAVAAPLILARSQQASRSTPSIPEQLSQLEILLTQVEDNQHSQTSLRLIKSTVNKISTNLRDFENVVEQRENARSHFQKLSREFSAELVNIQRPLFPAMVLLDSKGARIKQLAAAQDMISLARLADESIQLQRLDTIMHETTSISNRLLSVASETHTENLDIFTYPLKRSVNTIEKNIANLNDPYKAELNSIFANFVSYILGENNLIDARHTELQAANRGESLLSINRVLSSQLTSAVDHLVEESNREIENAAQEAQQAYSYGTRFVVSTLLLTLLSSALIFWFFIERNLIRRIRALHEDMLAVAGGDLNRQLSPTSEDELGHMSAALSVFRDTAVEIKKTNVRELRKAKNQAEQASRMKSEFLVNMSHELRTPLNSVIGISEMVLEDARELPDSEQIVPLTRISNAGKQLLRLINGILDLASIESGKMSLVADHTDIAALIDEAVTVSQPLAKRSGCVIRSNVSPELETIYTDPLRLRQIILQLLDNACKFTNKGTIDIKVRSEQYGGGPTFILFEVADTGIGIDPGYLPYVFKVFSQSDGSTTRRYSGTGLGLAICERLSELMAGSITATSTQEKGSIFTLKLPLSIEALNCTHTRGVSSPG